MTSAKPTAPRSSAISMDSSGSISFCAAGKPDAPEDLLDGLSQAFARGSSNGLLRLAHPLRGATLPPNLAWWRAFALTQASRLCRGAGHELELDILRSLCQEAPSSAGLPSAEYLAIDHLRAAGADMAKNVDAAAALAKAPRRTLLAEMDPAWSCVGRIHFNLGEDFANTERPFTFGASYVHDLSSDGSPTHIPLGTAIKRFALGERQKELDSAVLPLYAAAKKSDWIAAAVADPTTGPLLKTSEWTPAQAWALLRDAKKAEASGILVRLPESWGGKMPPMPSVHAFVGNFEPAIVGAKALLDFKMEVAFAGEPLTREEIDELAADGEGLRMIRGQWVMADTAGLGSAIRRFREIEERAKLHGLSFAEAMRLSATARDDLARAELPDGAVHDWQAVSAGSWLESSLEKLRSPAGIAMADPGPLLLGSLRPYQSEGLRWMLFLHALGLGACLADDMGLGKTIQILSLLLVLKRDQGQAPCLLAAPASLLENWANEAARFAPSLAVGIFHGNGSKDAASGDIDPAKIEGLDLVITSYGTLIRSKALREKRWRLAIADEAQAIKNPSTQTSKACKSLLADSRIALTGTPVENRLGDLWSLLDFTHPGLLGTRTEFNAFHSKLIEAKDLEPLRALVRPYVLRRKKTDKSVIADLPDKIETTELCQLTARQAALYQTAVNSMRKDLAAAQGFGRHGVVISYLTRLKQICNHPAHYLRDGSWRAADSGKILMLRELAQEISDSGGRLLVFTQYQEAVGPLTEHLAQVFGASGLALHGGIRPGKPRQGLVDAFQAEDGPPFMVLTVKAGGTGLNLTAANHVIHFDRWWNPAVENQATDRAFRIGQTRNVSVHKLVCKGTIEERIDEMIASKIQLAEDAVGDASGNSLSSLSDAELLDMVRLDIHSAVDLDED